MMASYRAWPTATRILWFACVLGLLCAVFPIRTSTADPAARPVNLEVRDVRFDPVAPGKNTVAVRVQNLTDQPQVFAIHIQTRTVGGWGARFLDSLAPGEEKWCRFAFRLFGFVPSRAPGEQVPISDQLTASAQALVELLVKEDFAGAVKDFDANVKAALPPEKLEEGWQSFIAQVGPFKRQVSVRAQKSPPYDAVFVTCQFEKATVDVKVSFNTAEQIAGLEMEESHNWIRLRFYNPPRAEDYRFEDYFLERKRSLGELEARTPVAVPVRPAPSGLNDTIVDRLKQIQDLLQEERYEDVWQAFTEGHRQAGFNDSFDFFKTFMNEKYPAFSWPRSEFVSLHPIGVALKGELAVVTADCGDAVWNVDFAREDGQWQIDWIGGYVAPVLLWHNWQQRLLPQLEKRTTPHFDIYYAKGSAAERDIDQIAQSKESGYQAIDDFLGRQDDVRIVLVFFEDQDIKRKETGHQGMGWATGTTIVEVHNDTARLDPFHETTHILAGPTGAPPALFGEGFAVYMSERLGAPPLKDLGGGELSVYERARQLKKEGEWVPLEELLTYTEIGSSASRPPVSYAEAGAFVKFLVEAYGKDRFLDAYATLKNSDKKEIHQQNLEALKRIYGKSLDALDLEWHTVMGLAGANTDSTVEAVELDQTEAEEE